MMECNKEEAIRAKGVAEQKMQNKDFVGARKIALKAQQLFPELDNISQMITVCNVHCSAEQKILGTEMNWYGILQVEQTADEASIKKQYRKLALQLHPDKNKFSGAEAAFKLIGEAQMVLLDQQKRSVYDMKHRASLRTTGPKPAPHQANSNSYVRKPPGVQNSFVKIATPQFTGLNFQQQPRFSNNQQTFWTTCPFCSIRYQYYREFVNRALRCQSCGKPFIAYDLDAQGMPPGGNSTQPVFPQQKEVQSKGARKVGVHNTAGNPPSMGFHGRFGSGSTPSECFSKTSRTSEVGLMNDVGKRTTFEAEKSGAANSKKRKPVSEPCDSSDSASNSDIEEDVVMEEDGDLYAGQNLEDLHPRRSTRQKRNVSYNENLSDDDDFVSPPNRSRGSGSSSAAEEETNKASINGSTSETGRPAGSCVILEEDEKELKQKRKAPLEESLPNGTGKPKTCKENGKEASLVDDHKGRSEVHENTEFDSGPKTIPDPEYYHCPDPDFSDFDKEREEKCFEAEQVWAVYDTLDGMPRFYVLIRKVLKPGFKLRITWLEPDPDDEDEIDWLSEELPVACGKFKHGNTENTEDHLMFSHLVYWEKGRTRGSYMIYPRKGEIWALFRNWNIEWKSDPDNHRQYEYEFVEVISDYAEGLGISVAYLYKVEGFVSLYQRTVKSEMASFQIPPTKIFRFSHMVPSFKMTGMERQDVPEGSYELDPAASLPAKNDDVKVDNERVDAKVDVESVDAKINESSSKSDKGIDSDEKNALERGHLRNGGWSTMDMNGTIKTPRKANADQRVPKEESGKHLGGSKHKNGDDFVRDAGTPSTACKVGEKDRVLDVDDTSSGGLGENHRFHPSPSSEAREIAEPKFHKFDAEKSKEKFQPGQIWALYSNKDGMPRNYAQIKKIESSPDFKLHITWLQACSLQKDIVQWLDKDMPISCGAFKLGSGKTMVYSGTDSVSHQLNAEPVVKKNKYDVYPRKGEVWALYRNWNAEWTCSDLENLKYDAVEVLENNELRTKVLVLVRVDGFKLVFKAERKRKSAVTLEIPRIELLRFSHQIPAFRLTAQRNGNLRGCWELDPAATPVLLRPD